MSARSHRPAAVLVTGGAGFIGSHVAEALLDSGCHVRILDDLSAGSRDNLPLHHPRLQFVFGDILDRRILNTVMTGVEKCVHLAAQVSVVRSLESPGDSARRNILGFINVLESARETGLQRLVYASSAAVYGEPEKLPLAEDACLRPMSPYGLEKYVDEAYADLYGRLYGLKSVGLRFFNVFGPRQDPVSPYSGVISKFLAQMLAGEPPVIFGDGKQTRDFIYVKDVAQAIRAALDTDYNGVCNVGTGRGVNLLKLARLLRNCLAVNTPPRFAEARMGDIPHSCSDTQRLQEHLGYVARTELESGLLALSAEQQAATRNSLRGISRRSMPVPQPVRMG